MTLLGGMKKTALGVIDKSAFKFKADAAFDSGGIRSASEFTGKEKQPGECGTSLQILRSIHGESAVSYFYCIRLAAGLAKQTAMIYQWWRIEEISLMQWNFQAASIVAA